MKFSEICTFAVIYAAYLAARRGKRSRAATAHGNTWALRQQVRDRVQNILKEEI